MKHHQALITMAEVYVIGATFIVVLAFFIWVAYKDLKEVKS